MKVDVVYKLGSGSENNNNEIRYSLRSLSKFKDLGKVYIVGYKPDFIQNVIHIPMEDEHKSNKDCNLINKLSAAAKHPDISDCFLNMSDDQIFLEEFSYEDFITPYFDNSVSNFKPDQRLRKWQKRLQNTIRILEEKRLPANCYDTHMPVLLRKDFPSIVMKYNYVDGFGMCGNTLYFNTLRAAGYPLSENHLVRIERPMESIEVIESLISGKRILNFSEMGENECLFTFLNKLLPIPSNFEIVE